MDFDFTRQLLASLRTRQIRLGDNFESPGRCFVLLRLDRRDPLDFIAFCEATFAEEATTGVSDDLARLIIIFRVHRLHFFFNSLWAVTIVCATRLSLLLLAEDWCLLLFFVRSLAGALGLL